MLNYHELRKRFKAIKQADRDIAPLWVICASMALLLVFMAGCSYASDTADVDMAIIASIESSNNPNAYNKRSGAVGLCQITPIVLLEFNKYRHTHYIMNDLYSPGLNKTIATWYMNMRIPELLANYGIKDTTRARLIAYNAGIRILVKKHVLPKETINYIIKYEDMKG